MDDIIGQVIAEDAAERRAPTTVETALKFSVFELRQQLAEVTNERDEWHHASDVYFGSWKRTEEELKASEARNAKLRSALEGMVEYFHEGHSDGECFSVEAANSALAKSAPATDEQGAGA